MQKSPSLGRNALAYASDEHTRSAAGSTLPPQLAERIAQMCRIASSEMHNAFTKPLTNETSDQWAQVRSSACPHNMHHTLRRKLLWRPTATPHHCSPSPLQKEEEMPSCTTPTVYLRQFML